MSFKRIHLFFLAFFAFIAFNSALAYDFQAGGVYYKIIGTSPNRVAVTNSGTSGSYTGTVVIPDSVSYNGTMYRVTEVADSAFFNDSSLVSVTLPGSLKVIGNLAFRNCVALSSITIPDSVVSLGSAAFQGCRLTQVFFNADSCQTVSQGLNQQPFKYISQLVIGNNVRYIPPYTFYACDSMTSITFGPSVKKIGHHAFYVTGVRVCYTGTLKQWCDIDFGHVANPLSWGSDLYISNRLVDTLSIPNTVDTIKKYSFYGASVSHLILPNSVKVISDSAFSECPKLVDVDFGDSLMSIGRSAFRDCSRLKSVTLPNTVVSLGEEAFQGCDSLLYAVLPDALTSIPARLFAFCLNLDSVNIPSVATIGDGAFQSSNLSRITLDSTVRNIGINAFAGGVARAEVHYWGTLAQWCKIRFESPYSNPLCRRGDFYISNQLVDTLSIPAEIDTILQYSFYSCKGMKRLVMSNSVRCIQRSAFEACDGLLSVAMSQNLNSIGQRAFCNSINIDSLVIPDTVAVIGNSAFSMLPLIIYHGYATGAPWGALCMNCFVQDSLYYTTSTRAVLAGAHKFISYANIPSTVRTINENAFYSCENLKKVVIPNSVTHIGSSAFYGCNSLDSVVLPNSLVTISSALFQNCSGLKDVVLGDSVTSIGQSAFYECENLASISLPNTLRIIGDYAFRSCSRLTSISIPASVDSLGYGAFFGSGLQSVSLPNGLTSCSDALFKNSKSLASVALGANTTKIGTEVFSGCDSLTNVNLPAALQSIGIYAFAYCNNLTHIDLPNSVTFIGNYAFINDSSLASINIPNSLKVLNSGTFHGCTGMNIAILGKSLEEINGYAFNGCTALDTVVFKPMVPPTMNNRCFFNDTFVAVVPCSQISYSRYRTALQGFVNAQVTNILQSDTVFTTLIVLSSDTNMGVVQVLTPHTCNNPTAEFSAQPRNGYHFVQWSDGNTQNPRTLTVTQDTVLIAYFAANQGIAEAGNDNITIQTANGHILLEGIGYEFVYVTDVLGRVIYNATVNERAEIAVKNQGIYFVKIGSRPAQKVVVIR